MNKFDYAGIFIAAFGGVILALITHYAVSAEHQRLYGQEVPATVLVGTGCLGESTIAVATDEDLMPMCAEIERHEVMTR